MNTANIVQWKKVLLVFERYYEKTIQTKDKINLKKTQGNYLTETKELYHYEIHLPGFWNSAHETIVYSVCLPGICKMSTKDRKTRTSLFLSTIILNCKNSSIFDPLFQSLRNWGGRQ